MILCMQLLCQLSSMASAADVPGRAPLPLNAPVQSACVRETAAGDDRVAIVCEPEYSKVRPRLHRPRRELSIVTFSDDWS